MTTFEHCCLAFRFMTMSVEEKRREREANRNRRIEERTRHNCKGVILERTVLMLSSQTYRGRNVNVMAVLARTARSSPVQTHEALLPLHLPPLRLLPAPFLLACP